MYLSVIVPFYNEENNLDILHGEIVKALAGFDFSSEIIYVDDGSKDESLKVLTKVVKDTPKSKIQVKIISFERNFGQTAGVAAGIEAASGDIISFLDADLQNDPADLPKFIDKLNQGYDAVFGWRKDRKDATFRSFFSKIANKIINYFFSYPYHDVGCSARVVKKQYLKKLQLYGELHRVMPVLIYLRGAKIGEIVVQHRSRSRGKSKYGFNRILKTMIDIITVKFLSSYGTKPAYVFGSAGFGSIFVSLICLVLVAYRKLFLGVFVHRDPIFLIAVFFGMIGVQFLLMGLLAELQVRTYFESQSKTIYDIKDVKNY